MNGNYKPADDSGVYRKDTFFFLSVALFLGAVAIFIGSLLSGCGSTTTADVQAFNAAVLADASSPAGQQLLADATTAALNVGLDVAAGNDVGASIAGVQGAASLLRDYEGLPTAPSAATIGQVAAAGSGVAHVATTLAPSIEQIVLSTQKSAQSKKIALTTDQITEAIAVGLDQVATVKEATPGAPVITSAPKAGEAP